jgi:hypothetical protein
MAHQSIAIVSGRRSSFGDVNAYFIQLLRQMLACASVRVATLVSFGGNFYERNLVRRDDPTPFD